MRRICKDREVARETDLRLTIHRIQRRNEVVAIESALIAESVQIHPIGDRGSKGRSSDRTQGRQHIQKRAYAAIVVAVL